MNQPPRRRFITKRACIALMLLLVMGAIVNVVVAWGCSLRKPPPPNVLDETYRDLNETDIAEMIERYGDPAWVASNEPVNIRSIHQIAFGMTFRQTAGQLGSISWQSVNYGVAENRFGLPLRSMRKGSRIELAAGARTPARALLDSIPIAGRRMPVGILWRGFAVNTVIYAAIVLAIVAPMLALRRRQRIRRGLCPTCAYPVGTSEVCTECGGSLLSPSGLTRDQVGSASGR